MSRSGSTDSPAPAPAPRTRKGSWLLRLGIGLPLIALVWWFVVGSLISDFRKIHWQHLSINWLYIAGALGALVGGRLMTAMNCKYVLGSMGQRVSHRQTVPIIWVASLGRYIPGKMAVVASAVIMLTRLGVAWTLALAALFLSTALMILVGLMSTVPLMFMPVVREKMPNGWAISIVMLLAGAVCLHPRIFTKLCNIVLRRMKRQPLPDQLELPSYGKAVLITLGRAFFLGLALWYAAGAFAPIGWKNFPLALASGGAASVAGFFAVFAPAGLGVHEAIYLLTMGSLLGPAGALLVVIFRILNLLSDVITWAAGMLMMVKGAVSRQTTPALATP